MFINSKFIWNSRTITPDDKSKSEPSPGTEFIVSLPFHPTIRCLTSCKPNHSLSRHHIKLRQEKNIKLLYKSKFWLTENLYLATFEFQ